MAADVEKPLREKRSYAHRSRVKAQVRKYVDQISHPGVELIVPDAERQDWQGLSDTATV
ncbi:hypothetical protein EYZ11_005590 [Aspergillus tanneri]|uniref:Uncharacterized protein n=1 Tax=Aspergillus tanneri TaxID=1220188 RepID=A0A4S3JNK5_9EURO|nr:hypothetical protein EYZ11_005590 [Aspergillus tanneri]